MKDPKEECMICGREPEDDEDFIETEHGFICMDCKDDLNEPQVYDMKEYDFEDV